MLITILITKTEHCTLNCALDTVQHTEGLGQSSHVFVGCHLHLVDFNELEIEGPDRLACKYC